MRKKYVSVIAIIGLIILYLVMVAQLGAENVNAVGAIIWVFLAGRAIAEKIGARERGLLTSASVLLAAAVLLLFVIVSSFTGQYIVALALIVIICTPLFFLKGQLQIAQKSSFKTQVFLVVVCSLLVALFFFEGAVSYAHPSVVGAVTPSQDFFWNLGNAESIKSAMPPADLRFAGVTLTYHYLTEILGAGISILSGTSCYDVLAFYLPPALLIALIAVLWELGNKLFGSTKKQMVLLLLVFGTGCAGLHKTFSTNSPFLNLLPVHLVTNINAVTTSFLFIAIFIGFFFTALEDKLKDKTSLSLAMLALLLLIFTKGPIAGIVAISAAGVLLVLALRKNQPRVKYIIIAGLILASFYLVYSLMFSAGAESSVGFDLTGTLEKTYFKNFLLRFAIENKAIYYLLIPIFMVSSIVLFMPATSIVVVAAAFIDIKKFRSCAPWRLFCYSAVVGGMTAFLIFDHPNLSQIYFAFIASFAASLLAADSLVDFLSFLTKKNTIISKSAIAVLSAFLAVGVTTAGITYIGMVAEGADKLINGEQSAMTHESRAPLTSGDEQAMDWLCSNMQDDELFLTNRMHTGTALEGLSNVYTGLSGKQAYMESGKYAVSNMGIEQSLVKEREDIVNKIFSDNISSNEIKEICEQIDVKYIVYSRFIAGSNKSLEEFETSFQNVDVIIYKVS